MKQILVICGATASGKSELALALAQRMGGEIVCADSMQIYRGMDIGTAKPTAAERAMVPHHMTDVAEPGEHYSAARYAQEGGRVVEDILSRGKIPILCGGTGLYINALIRGSGFPESGTQSGLREKLEAMWEEQGGAAMLSALTAVDPQSAARLHPNDKKRIIRALEVWEATGMTLGEHHAREQQLPPRYGAVLLAPNPREREALYRRIDRRVDRMMESGLADEARALWESGKLIGTAAQAIGYKELVDWFRGRQDEKTAVNLIKQKTRNYAKRQLTWFHADPGVHWILYDTYDLTQILPEATEYLLKFGYNKSVF